MTVPITWRIVTQSAGRSTYTAAVMTSLVLATAAQLAALQPIVGSWHSADPADKTDVTSRCAWSPAHQFVICDQEGTFQGKPFTALSIYGWSEAKKGYIFYGA